MSFELNVELIDTIKRAVESGNTSFIKENLSGLHVADLSIILDQIDTYEAKCVFELLDDEICADIMSNLDEDKREKFVRAFTSKELAIYFEYIDSDDAVDILHQQGVKFREEVIALIKNQEKANDIIDLLHYKDDCAGGLMAKEFIKANINWNIKECIEEIRRQVEKIEKILTVYVVDDFDILIGRVSLKEIILAKDETKIKDLCISDIITVQTYYDQEEVADIMQKYDLEVIPVVNVKGKILGRITIDDIIDIITEEAERERQIMSGLTEDIEEDDSIWIISKARLPWLIIGMMGGLLGAQFIGFFEKDLTLIPAMAFFIPLITATGGNVGIQSSTIVVQTLADKTTFIGSISQRLIKVLIVAIINGIVISLIVFSFNMFFANVSLSIIVSVALFCVVLLASFVGTVTPLVLNKIGINPALASGPFITTANDLLGLAVYFMVARVLYDF